MCPQHLLECPECWKRAATGDIIENESMYNNIYPDWWRTLKCSSCSHSWYICIHCVTTRKHITDMRKLHYHYRELHLKRELRQLRVHPVCNSARSPKRLCIRDDQLPQPTLVLHQRETTEEQEEMEPLDISQDCQLDGEGSHPEYNMTDGDDNHDKEIL